jgi:hypothetical protein
MCTELLPPGGYQIAVKYISYRIICFRYSCRENPNTHFILNKRNPVTGPVVAQSGVEAYLYSSKTSALEGSEWSAARSGRTLPPGKNRYPLNRRLAGPQGRFGRAENLVPTEIRSPGRPARSQSLYRLSYRAHFILNNVYYKIVSFIR